MIKTFFSSVVRVLAFGVVIYMATFGVFHLFATDVSSGILLICVSALLYGILTYVVYTITELLKLALTISVIVRLVRDYEKDL